jgi:hypothetical protein
MKKVDLEKLDELRVEWQSLPSISRAVVIKELDDMLLSWSESADTIETQEDVKALSIILATVRECYLCRLHTHLNGHVQMQRDCKIKRLR